MKVLKIIGKVFEYTLLAIMVTLVILNVYLIVNQKITGKKQSTIFGIASAVVKTGSMVPTLNPNDYIILKAENKYNVDDIIMFEDGNSLTTHRIIEITTEGYKTKGDANNTPDMNIVGQDKVVGKVVFKLAKVGIVINYFKTLEGIITLVLIIATLVTFEIFLSKRKQNNSSNKS